MNCTRTAKSSFKTPIMELLVILLIFTALSRALLSQDAPRPFRTFDSTKTDHPAVLRFDGRFHMWYTAGDKSSRYKIGYATSPDGIHWKRENKARPVFGPGESGRFDDQVVLHPAVVRDDSGQLHKRLGCE